MSTGLINFSRLRSELPAAAAGYAGGTPFPHAVIDGVLTAQAFDEAVAEFPAVDDPFWRGYLHVNETKYSNTAPDTWGATLSAVAKEFCGPEFVAYLEQLTGITGLIPDWSMDGGGLHQTLRGGHLNIHADFSTHHVHENWARRVNILLYLNAEWPAEWGGQLELWDREMRACAARIAPAGNRMLVFTTSLDSYHGHPDPLRCPEGQARRSLALYYFTEEPGAVRRSTNYRARPGDGSKKVAIWVDRTALDLYDRAKRRFNISDATVQRVFRFVERFRRR